MTITCGIQPTNVVTMVMKVLHNSCNMCTLDLTDMYALTFGPAVVHTFSQITCAHVTIITSIMQDFAMKLIASSYTS